MNRCVPMVMLRMIRRLRRRETWADQLRSRTIGPDSRKGKNSSIDGSLPGDSRARLFLISSRNPSRMNV